MGNVSAIMPLIFGQSIIIIIIIIIIIPRQCLCCCHHGRAVARVHPVRLMNVERRQAAADPRPSQATFSVSVIGSGLSTTGVRGLQRSNRGY